MPFHHRSPSALDGCRRSPRALGFLAALLVLPVSRTVAQTPAAEGEATFPVIALEVAGFGGAIVPLGQLTRNRFGFDTNLASTGAVGGDASVWHRSGFGVAFEATYSHMAVNQSAGEEGFVVPGGLGDADYLAGVVELRYRYRPAGERAVVQPEWGLGAGFRRIDVDPIAEPDLEDSADFVGSVRAAVYVPLAGRWGARVGVRATRGAYGAGISDEEVSHTDIVVGVGLVARLY